VCGGRGRDAIGKHVLHGIADARKVMDVAMENTVTSTDHDTLLL
jgi:hypothetical protein